MTSPAMVRLRHPLLDREQDVHPSSVDIYARSGWVPVEPDQPARPTTKGAARGDSTS